MRRFLSAGETPLTVHHRLQRKHCGEAQSALLVGKHAFISLENSHIRASSVAAVGVLWESKQ